jgi:glycosyltransferase domain-containing protein
MDSTLDDKLTLIIATKNKPDVLRAVLKYYSSVKFPYKILIADDTNIKRYKKYNIDSVAKSNDLKIEYLNLQTNNMFKSIVRLLERVGTPYVLNSGDDDFFSLKTINKIIYFLESDKDFVSAGGISVKLNAFWDTNYKKWRVVNKLNGTTDNSISDNLVLRLINYARRLKVTTYNITRTRPLLRAYKLAENHNLFDTPFATELFQNSLLLAGGKNRTFLSFYHYWFAPINRRKINALKTNKGDKNHSFSDLVSLKTTNSSISFLNLLSSEFNKKFNLDKIIANNLARSVWLSYWSGYYHRRRSEALKESYFLVLSAHDKIAFRLHFFVVKFFGKLRSFWELITYGNYIKEILIHLYVKNVFLLGRLKLNDSIKIRDMLNNETINFLD